MVVSQNKGRQYRPQHNTILIIGRPTRVPLILGIPIWELAAYPAEAILSEVGREGSKLYRGHIRIMENQMENHIDNEMETIIGYIFTTPNPKPKSIVERAPTLSL